jgi:hypothetical protein
MVVIPPFQNTDVKSVFDSYPIPIREKLLLLRSLIFETAQSLEMDCPLEETLKWGEPSYIPPKKMGSMVRLHHYANKPFDFALYFMCKSTLVSSFRLKFGTTFQIGGNRSLEFMLSDHLPLPELKDCITMAMTYNLPKP